MARFLGCFFLGALPETRSDAHETATGDTMPAIGPKSAIARHLAT